MKVNILDAHDRYHHLIKQNFSIEECCQNLIDQRPFGDVPFYIYVHSRLDDETLQERLIWQPRLTKPKSSSNSMLFKAYPGQDLIKIIWIIPKKEMWSNYMKGNVAESNVVWDSIIDFMTNKEKLDKKEDDDLSDEAINHIYQKISQEAKEKKLRQDSLEASSNASAKEEPDPFQT